jgi:hypothetical protein
MKKPHNLLKIVRQHLEATFGTDISTPCPVPETYSLWERDGVSSFDYLAD